MYIPCYTDLVLQSTIIFSCASSTLETARIPPKKNGLLNGFYILNYQAPLQGTSSHHEKTQDRAAGWECYSGTTPGSCPKNGMCHPSSGAKSWRFWVDELQVTWGNSRLFERKTSCFGKKVKGKGKKNEIETVFNVF